MQATAVRHTRTEKLQSAGPAARPDACADAVPIPTVVSDPSVSSDLRLPLMLLLVLPPVLLLLLRLLLWRSPRACEDNK